MLAHGPPGTLLTDHNSLPIFAKTKWQQTQKTWTVEVFPLKPFRKAVIQIWEVEEWLLFFNSKRDSYNNLLYSGLRFPGLRFPGLSFPGLRFPGLRFPGLRFPGLRFPGLRFPGLSFPGLRFPGLRFPGLRS